mgnify:CR=1 FL=1
MTLFSNVKKILVIQTGDVGDVVWMTPTLSAIKAACPQVELSILLREGSGAILDAHPAVDKIIEIRKYQGSLWERFLAQLRFLRDIRGERFDVVIDLRAGDRGAIMARLSGAPIRVARYLKGLPFWRNYCFTHLVKPPLREKVETGAAEQSLGIVRELGMDPPTTVPRLWVREEVKKRVEELLQKERVAGNAWCSLNPFSRWSYKELPYDRWVTIIDWLWEEFGTATVLVGSEGERKKGADLAAACSGRVYNLAGRTSLAELAGILSMSSLHIGVDSAAPHIAAAVGTRTVTIYGPSDWRDWAPPGEHHKVIVADGDCVPCHRKGCDGSNMSRCLATLPAEKIKEALRSVLPRALV